MILKEYSHYSVNILQLIYNLSLLNRKSEVSMVLTLIIEAVYSVNTGTFVVTPEQEEVFWVFDLVG